MDAVRDRGRLFRVLNEQKTPIIASATSFIVGSGIGYFFGRRHQKPEVHQLPELTDFGLKVADIGKVQRAANNLVREEAKKKRGTTVIPPMERPPPVIIDEEDYVKREADENDVVIEIPVDPGETVSDETQGENGPDVVTRSVFAGNDDEWDYEKEVKSRSTAEPYVIHKDEFYSDEMGYDQTTLTYYQGDNVLVSQDEQVIYNPEAIVGPYKFGHGSGDPRVFHVRNDKLRAEYEILLDSGLYEVEVLGLDDSEEREKGLKHSSGGVKRFRQKE